MNNKVIEIFGGLCTLVICNFKFFNIYFFFLAQKQDVFFGDAHNRVTLVFDINYCFKFPTVTALLPMLFRY